jgi:hypothetical protein
VLGLGLVVIFSLFLFFGEMEALVNELFILMFLTGVITLALACVRVGFLFEPKILDVILLFGDCKGEEEMMLYFSELTIYK